MKCVTVYYTPNPGPCVLKPNQILSESGVLLYKRPGVNDTGREMTGKKHRGKPRQKTQGPQGAYWMYGQHACAAAIANPARHIRRIAATRNAAPALPPERTGLAPVEILSPAEIDRLLRGDAVHQGIAMLVEPLEGLALEDMLLSHPKGGSSPPNTSPQAAEGAVTSFAGSSETLLILDQITDPHNVGAIFRTAAAFSVRAIIMPKDGAAHESGALAKAACGALDIVPYAPVTNLARALDDLKEAGWWVLGLDGEATTAIGHMNTSGKTALVLGAEGKGMRRLTAERCDLLARIPISAAMESLNVSNAAAIALYAITRK